MSSMVFLYSVIRVVIDGMEEFLIAPTAWYYIDSFGESSLFLGVTLAAYSIGALLFSPCFGVLDDRFQATKSILVLCAVIRFLGNLLYSIPVNAYFPLFGRFVSGVAGASVGVLYGIVAKYSDNKHRAKAFLFFEGLFTLGTALAPSIGSFLSFNIDILGWKIGLGNSPGFILAIFWLFMIILSLFLPKDLGCDESLFSDEIQLDSKWDDENDNFKSKPNDFPKLIDSKISCLYFTIFMAFTFYCFTAFYVPLLAALFNLQLIHVKILFLNGTLVLLVAYLFNYIASEYTSERTLVLVFVALQFLPLCLLFYFAVSWNSAGNTLYGGYLLLPLICLGLPCLSFPVTCSLISKVTDVNHAAFYQSLSSTVGHLAVISSRLVAGLTFSKTSFTFTCLGLTLFWIVQVVWFFVEYQNLVPIRAKA